LKLESQILNRYKLGSIIGEGGQSHVYEAQDVATNEEVIVKIIARNQMKLAPGISEFSALLSVDHPNLIHCLDFEYGKDGSTIIVYERIRGGSLRSFLESEADVSFDFWNDCAAQCLQGLKHLHQAGLVHCDLKPENILLQIDSDTQKICFKIADFGLARSPSSDRSPLSSGAGSPAYMAPEAFTGKHSIASDLYSLGIILYELAAGKRPFTGTVKEIARQHYYSPIDLDALRFRSVALVIDQLLQKKTQDRFKSAENAFLGLPNSNTDQQDLAQVLATVRNLKLKIAPVCTKEGSTTESLALLSNSNLDSVFHIDTTAKTFEVIQAEDRPYILAKHLNHFELFDGTNGKPLNQFISVSGNNYQIIRDSTLITYTDSNVYMWTSPFTESVALTEIGISTQTLAVDNDLERILWIERNTVFQKDLDSGTSKTLLTLKESGLPSRILFSRDGEEAIIIPGSTRPTASWFNRNGERTGQDELGQPLLDSANRFANIGISYPPTDQEGQGGLSVWFFQNGGKNTSRILPQMPSSYTFFRSSFIYERTDGAVYLSGNEQEETCLGKNPDRSSSLLFPDSADYFYTINKDGLRHHFKLYQYL